MTDIQRRDIPRDFSGSRRAAGFEAATHGVEIRFDLN